VGIRPALIFCRCPNERLQKTSLGRFSARSLRKPKSGAARVRLSGLIHVRKQAMFGFNRQLACYTGTPREFFGTDVPTLAGAFYGSDVVGGSRVGRAHWTAVRANSAEHHPPNFLQISGSVSVPSTVSIHMPVPDVEERARLPVLPLNTHLQNPLLRALARRDSGGYDPLVALQPKGTKAPLFCVHPGVGEVLIYPQPCQLFL